MEIEKIRSQMTELHKALEEEIASTKPPVVQELTLAMRDLENSRMRLGVAIALQNGLNPWESK